MSDTEAIDLGPNTLRITLYSQDSEQAVLGSVFINAEIYPALSAILSGDDFYLIKHRWIWDAFGALTRGQTPIDVLTVAKELERRDQLAEAGGVAYLTYLISAVPTSIHAEAYAVLVRSDSVRRGLLEAASKVASLAYEEGKSLDLVIEQAVTTVRDVSKRGIGPSTLRPLSDYSAEVYNEFDDPKAREALIVPTGFSWLDKALGGGPERMQSVIVAGRPGMGKTAWLVQAADYLASSRRRVAIFSKEMSARQIYRRMACRAARVSWKRHKEGLSTDEEFKAIGRELERINQLGADGWLFVDDSSEQTTGQVRRECFRLGDKWGGVDAVLSDHLRLFADRAENETIRLGKMSWGFKQISRDMNAVCVTGVQLNNDVEHRQNKRPTLADIRGSGEIAENADIVIGLYRAAYYAELDRAASQSEVAVPDDNTAEMWILKNRDGESQSLCKCVFIPDYMSFEPIARPAVFEDSFRRNGQPPKIKEINFKV